MTINTFDLAGSPVADFTFQQLGNDVSLSVRSLTSVPVNLTYRIEFLLNATSWRDEGSVQGLQPGQTVDQGNVAHNPARIDLGAFRIVLTSIQPA